MLSTLFRCISVAEGERPGEHECAFVKPNLEASLGDCSFSTPSTRLIVNVPAGKLTVGRTYWITIKEEKDE
jgi:hypothetical protein